jgi:hydroxyacylglutathione hydrolase
MMVQILPVGMLQCNCVILACQETREALIVDPGDEAERILHFLEERRLKACGILHTHAHLDHIGATAAVAKATGAPTLLHEQDLPLYQAVEMQAAFIGVETPDAVAVDRYVRDGEFLSVGRLKGEILHTPGHSPGGICLYLPGNPEGVDPAESSGLLLAGDTLFAGSIGRTDLWGGDHEQLLHSIRHRLLALPDETIVIPGHGPRTTIQDERRANPFLNG